LKYSFIKGDLRVKLRRQALTRSGVLARTVLYPNPFSSPAHQATVHVARDAGIGDVLMFTPALRELKRVNPEGRINFYTKFTDLVQGLPYIDEVHPYSALPEGALYIEYTHIVPSPVHISRLIGDKLGVRVTDTQPDCVVEQGTAGQYAKSWEGLPRPWVVATRRASRFTPNKDWPNSSWVELIHGVRQFGTVIEVGNRDGADTVIPSDNYLDLRDSTSIKELVAVIAAADIYVGPVSGPMHIAAAVHTPSVVVIGGFEHPVNTHYAGNVEFYTPLPCSPCWLRDPCPFDLKCLHAISSGQVTEAIRKMWATTQG
jgi:ADP-heptose:LPS heptosyltransferase